MSPNDISLLERWQNHGDPRAFHEIVNRHANMVYGACQRILYNPSDAEEVVQECFLALARGKKRNITILGGWLHTFATHRALDRLRKDKRRQQREHQYAQTQPTQVEPKWNDVERFVDDAIAALPEQSNSVIVGHFLEGRSQADLAQTLGVSPSAVSRRIDRGVEHIRKSLRRQGVMVSAVALAALLSEAANAAAPPALVASLGKIALVGNGVSSTVSAGTAAVTATTSLAAKWVVSALVVAGIAALGLLVAFQHLQSSNTTNAIAEASSVSFSTPEIAMASDANDVPPQPSTALDQGEGVVMGVVVFRGSGLPAKGMRVLFGTEDNNNPASAVTDADGTFQFNSVSPGKKAVLAYDARYTEMPEDWLRSELTEVDLAQGQVLEGLRIEVPAQGGQISGRVYDKNTGEPISGIKIEAIRWGETSLTGTSGPDGSYTILGLPEGESLVRVGSNNPVFSSDLVNAMMTVQVPNGQTVPLDIAIDRGVAISGRVVNAAGEPVSDAGISTELFLSDRRMAKAGSWLFRCYFRTDDQGNFTVWGGQAGDRAVLSAIKDDLRAHIAVVNPVPAEAVHGVLLTLYPSVRVTGRFIDENGAPVKANLWSRQLDPNGDGDWTGQAEDPSVTFEAKWAPGDYEVKGREQNHDFGADELTQTLRVEAGTAPDVTIRIATNSAMKGQYALHGVVVDERGLPLTNTRVYIGGSTSENIRSFQETHTDSQGRFAFTGLMDADYRVHATPGDPFEQFAGFDKINPASMSEVRIVARTAARLLGKVVDAQTSAPVRNFRAELGEIEPFDRKMEWEQKTVTSETGEFDLPARLDKDWYLLVAADGYVEMVKTGEALTAGQKLTGLEIRLVPGRIIHGNVIDTNGNPVAGALVYDNDTIFDPSRQDTRHAAAITDSDGRFEVTSLPEGAALLYISKPGYAIAKAAIENDMSIVLKKGGAVEGRVFIGGVAAPSDTMVMARDVNNMQSQRNGEVDENGLYRITELPDGAYRLDVRISGGTPGVYTNFGLSDYAESADGLTTTVDIAIPTGTAAVEGTLLKDGAPAAGITLCCQYAGCESYTRSDATGRYRFDSLPAGAAQVEAYVPSGQDPANLKTITMATVQLQDGAVAQADYDLTNAQ